MKKGDSQRENTKAAEIWYQPEKDIKKQDH